MATPEELMIANTMLNVPKVYPKLDPPHGPRIAFYTTPERMFAIDYEQTDNDRLMNYIDKNNGQPYAWISDDGLKPTTNRFPKTLGEYIDHPLLFKAYPELKDRELNFNQDEYYAKRGRSSDSWFNTKDKSYHIADIGKYSDTMHEVGHDIQGIEGWFPYELPTEFGLARKKAGVEDNEVDYRNTDSETQAMVSNQVFTHGIPSTGVRQMMEDSLMTATGNPYTIGDPRFKGGEKTLAESGEGYFDFPLFDTPRIPGTSIDGLDYDLSLFLGGEREDMYNDMKLQNMGAEETVTRFWREYENSLLRKIDGPNVVNPHIKNPFKGFGR